MYGLFEVEVVVVCGILFGEEVGEQMGTDVIRLAHGYILLGSLL